jgi:hypothetical protein
VTLNVYEPLPDEPAPKTWRQAENAKLRLLATLQCQVGIPQTITTDSPVLIIAQADFGDKTTAVLCETDADAQASTAAENRYEAARDEGRA